MSPISLPLLFPAARTGTSDKDASSVKTVRNARKPEIDLERIDFLLFFIFNFILLYIRYDTSVIMLRMSPKISDTSVTNRMMMNIMNAIPTMVTMTVSMFLKSE